MTPRFDFSLSRDYMSKLTLSVAMDSDSGILHSDTSFLPNFQRVSSSKNLRAKSSAKSNAKSNGAWIEVKELMLKHFLPEDFSKIQHTRDRIKAYTSR